MSELKGKIFTGQAYIQDGINRWDHRESVACGKCGRPIGLRTVFPEDTGLAWFDPYRGKIGKYVHFECLSLKRKKEIEAINVEAKTPTE